MVTFIWTQQHSQRSPTQQLSFYTYCSHSWRSPCIASRQLPSRVDDQISISSHARYSTWVLLHYITCRVDVGRMTPFEESTWQGWIPFQMSRLYVRCEYKIHANMLLIKKEVKTWHFMWLCIIYEEYGGQRGQPHVRTVSHVRTYVWSSESKSSKEIWDWLALGGWNPSCMIPIG